MDALPARADPPRLAKEAKTEEEALGHYRRVRDEIRHFIERLEEYLPLTRGRHAGIASVLDRYNVNQFAASVKVYAVKPGAA